MANLGRYSGKFKSVWAQEILEYLKIKDATGFNISPIANNLLALDRFCNEKQLKEKIFTREDADAYRLTRNHEATGTRYKRVNTAKLFFEW